MNEATSYVSATITRWPNGNHYYAVLHGKGIHIQERFNQQTEAQRFLDEEIQRLEADGYTIVRPKTTQQSP